MLTTLLDYNTQKELMASFQKVNPMKSAENPERFAKQLQKISTSSSSSHEEPKPWYYVTVMVIYTHLQANFTCSFAQNQEKNPCEPKEHEFYYFLYESRPPSFGNERKNTRETFVNVFLLFVITIISSVLLCSIIIAANL